MEQIFQSSNGHKIFKSKNNLLVQFGDEVRVYSTSQLNGGITVLKSCFNHKLSQWVERMEDLPGGSTREYFKLTAADLGLDSATATGLMTTASLDKACLIHEKYEEISVFSLVTAGVKENAVRAGDPSYYYEVSFQKYIPVGGTINIIAVIEAFLPVESLTRAAATIVEAKAAALQDLCVPSCYSDGTATGTGSDGLIIACHKNDEVRFSDAGGHSKLGELLGRTVKKALYGALLPEGYNIKRRI